MEQQLSDTSIVAFTKQLIAPAENDLEKIRAIFVFVIHYLKYDNQSAGIERKRINQNVSDILLRKKGICWDYSQLICRMSEIAEIPCFSVIGFSKDLNNERKIGEQPDHAWNIVQIDNQYYLVDATWESNTLRTQDYFKQTYKVDYFLTDPRLFIANHLPCINAFQLLSCPVDFQDFESGHDFTTRDTTCQFNFKDSIQEFLSFTFLDQKILENKSAYHILPNPKNESAWGHALMDKAIDLKESGDQYFEKGDHTLAKSSYEEAFHYFSKAEIKAAAYPWQNEARAFCHLNYAQILYRLNHETGKSFKPVLEHLHKSKSILEGFNGKSFAIKSALEQINYQISVLE